MAARGEAGAIVTLLCDPGERYLDTYYNDAWLAAGGSTRAARRALRARLRDRILDAGVTMVRRDSSTRAKRSDGGDVDEVRKDDRAARSRAGGAAARANDPRAGGIW